MSNLDSLLPDSLELLATFETAVATSDVHPAAGINTSQIEVAQILLLYQLMVIASKQIFTSIVGFPKQTFSLATHLYESFSR